MSVSRKTSGRLLVLLLPAWGLATAPASGSSPTQVTRPSSDAEAASSESEVPEGSPGAADNGRISLGGYVEGFYSDNFNRPSNRITNFRGFDNRESTFTLSNAAVSVAWEKSAVSGRVTAQVGHTPDTYYLAEPAAPGTSSTPPSNATTTWKYLQEAWVGYKTSIGRGVLFQGGLFLSPIGVENMPIKDNWNWSRSNLFFGLPFYHAGLKASYELSKEWTAELMVCNGWNDIVDNNRSKSVMAHVIYKPSGAWNVNFLYFGGVERPTGAPEGQPWRHLFDAYATWDATKALSLSLHADAGFERNNFGTSDWAAAAGYARIRLSNRLFLAARADVFREEVASNDHGTASSIFWPGKRVASQTLTLDYRPLDNISVRLEGRHDAASTAMYFHGMVSGDGSAGNPYVPNARSQKTVTLGATTWF
jgi:Putative beta-barrel porin-2, OmpL-like. bbp2